MKKLTDEKEVAELYAAGYTIEKVAEKLEVSTQTVRNTMIKYNIPRRAKGPKKREKPAAGKQNQEVKAGIKCTEQVMRTCIYANSNGDISCDYIGVTGHMRGCSPDNCTRYVKTAKKRRSSWYGKDKR